LTTRARISLGDFAVDTEDKEEIGMHKPSRIAATVVFGLLLTSVGRHARAGYISESIGLTKSVALADTIALCKIVAITPVPEAVPANTTTTQHITDVLELLKATAVQPASTYRMKILQTIRGSHGGDLELSLPFISAHYYGAADLKVTEGSYCLVLEMHGMDGRMRPVDSTVPLIPLKDGSSTTALTAEARIVDLILKSSEDPSFRRSCTYLLARVRSAEAF
jgi:hypothetical protein